MDYWLRADLLRRARRDRWAREEWLDNGGAWSMVRRIDAENTSWLSGIIEQHGWPGHELAGVDGAHAAWLLTQHAPPEKRADWLGLLRNAVERGDARARDLAFLEDRVDVDHQRPQRYGTQWGSPDGSQPRLFPLADGQVNARRAALGLPTLAEHDLRNAWDRTTWHRRVPTASTSRDLAGQ